MAVTQFSRLIEVLVDGHIEFVLVGGFAGKARGASRVTEDIDILYRRTTQNIERVIAALKPLQPYPRGAPPGLPFRFDVKQIQNGLNFTFETTLGWLDLLGEVSGGGSYEQMLPYSSLLRLFDRDVMCVELQTLIALKRAAGRPKDFEAIAELESLRLRSKDKNL